MNENRRRNMETKMIEIRDRMTFIPAMATRMATDEHWSADFFLLSRSGMNAMSFAPVALTWISNGQTKFFAEDWNGSRTMTAVHEWLVKNWDKFESGGVIDVEFILGETEAPKVSERHTNPYVEAHEGDLISDALREMGFDEFDDQNIGHK